MDDILKKFTSLAGAMHILQGEAKKEKQLKQAADLVCGRQLLDVIIADQLFVYMHMCIFFIHDRHLHFNQSFVQLETMMWGI